MVFYPNCGGDHSQLQLMRNGNPRCPHGPSTCDRCNGVWHQARYCTARNPAFGLAPGQEQGFFDGQNENRGLDRGVARGIGGRYNTGGYNTGRALFGWIGYWISMDLSEWTGLDSSF